MLEKIQKPNDIKKIPADQLPALAEEIREFIIESLSKTGGHLASNLGVVELTIAMHRVFDLPKDKLIWDVGHQSYTHKILTGRKDGFETLRREGGISGFPKRSESDCDVFDTGHSSTSISAGVGYVRARELKKENYSVVSIIGDGALTGGMAYEALNNAASLKSNFIIVLNDNEMSITENVGGMSSYLSGLRTASAYTDFKMDVTKALNRIPGIGPGMVDAMRKTKSSIKQIIIPGMLFEDMGLTYLGPVDGHNIPQLIKTFQEAKRFEGPILVHVLTQKGRGYEPAMRHPARFHGAGPFDVKTGLPVGKSNPTYTDVFSTVMRKMGDRRKDVAAVTAAMMTGVGLKRFSNMFPDRCFDVGIAEEHAVTFAAALSLGGITPVVAIYSSFLQRAYDPSLTFTTAPLLSVARANVKGASAGNYALFAGGRAGSFCTTVDAYNASLTRTTATALSSTKNNSAAATVGNHAIFVGNTASADIYDASLTKTSAAILSTARTGLAATTVGDYAIFSGGGVADFCDASLTRSSIGTSMTGYDMGAATIGDYALFAGGHSGEKSDTAYDSVEVYTA